MSWTQQRRSNHEANLSAESDPPPSSPWVPGPDEDPRWPLGARSAAGQGPHQTGGFHSVQVTGIRVDQRFRRTDRLRSSKDFRRVSREGVRVASRSFVLLLAKQREATGDGHAKLGVTVSRKVGNSVVRTRLKRQIREWFRRNRDGASWRRDLVIIARPAAANLEYAELSKELEGALCRVAKAGTR